MNGEEACVSSTEYANYRQYSQICCVPPGDLTLTCKDTYGGKFLGVASGMNKFEIYSDSDMDRQAKLMIMKILFKMLRWLEFWRYSDR